MTGISFSVDQLLGRSAVPASAAPLGAPSLAKAMPKRKPGPKAGPRVAPKDKLLATIDGEWRSVHDTAIRARVSQTTAYAHLEALATIGAVEGR